MKTDMTCLLFRERLVDNREGGMDPILRQAWEDHRRNCAACAEEASRDDNLCGILAAQPMETPVPVSWPQVLARQTGRRSAARRPAVWALAGATLAALFVLVIPLGQHPLSVPSTGGFAPSQSEVAEGQAYTNTHMLVSVGNPSSDPNRAIFLAYSGGEVR